MITQVGLWAGAAVAAGVTVASGLAEHRRNKRRDLDSVGWVNWQLVQIFAVLIALVLVALALKAD
jgi:hypothetical protein